MAKWLEDITQALRNIGGVANLQEIYDEVERIRTNRLPQHWQASIRGIIEDNSSDSARFKGKDVFYSAEGLGRGIWGLRNFLSTTPEATDISDLPELEAERAKLETYRILRDTQLSRTIKALHSNACQICGQTISLPTGGTYSEAHHIQPLGKPHNGPDIAGNILVLCPNHHVMCDYGAIQLDLKSLLLRSSHKVEKRFVEYHNRVIAKS